MKKPSCGLDFGTSNSTFGVVDAGGMPHLVPLEGDNSPLPSVLFFNFEDDCVYFGRAALHEYMGGTEGRMMRALKSVLGTSLMKDRTRIKQRQITFTQILETFLKEMHLRAQTNSNIKIEQVVAGRPVHFVDGDPHADLLAQEQLEAAIKGAGFRHVEFQFEPIAAALDYERTIHNEQLAMVVDIGGGTSDFTIIRLSPERAKLANRKDDILATGGVHVGGTDFDRLFSMARIMPLLGLGSHVKSGNADLPIGPYFDLASWHRINRLYSRDAMANLKSMRQQAALPMRVDRLISIVEGRFGHLLASTIETAKIELTERQDTHFEFSPSQIRMEESLSRAEFDKAISETVARIPQTIDSVLTSAGLVAQDIQTLIMTGGSTQTPILREQLNVIFAQSNFVQNDAFGSVGLGLALDASRRF